MVSLAGAVAIGVVGVVTVGVVLVPFIVVGPCSWWPTTPSCSAGWCTPTPASPSSWGAFPVLTAYVAQTGTLRPAPVLVAGARSPLSWAQRSLSTPARLLRRSVDHVDGLVTMADGTVEHLDARALLAPLERALRAMSWGMVGLAAGLAVARLS